MPRVDSGSSFELARAATFIIGFACAAFPLGLIATFGRLNVFLLRRHNLYVVGHPVGVGFVYVRGNDVLGTLEGVFDRSAKPESSRPVSRYGRQMRRAARNIIRLSYYQAFFANQCSI